MTKTYSCIAIALILSIPSLISCSSKSHDKHRDDDERTEEADYSDFKFDKIGFFETYNNYDVINDIKSLPDFSAIDALVKWSEILSPEIARVNVADTATVGRLLRSDSSRKILPRDLSFAWTMNPSQNSDSGEYGLIMLKGKSFMGSDDIINAEADSGDFGPEILVIVNNKASELWYEITRKNIGKNIAITLDDSVISYPCVTQPIQNGRISITGLTTLDEARAIARKLMTH